MFGASSIYSLDIETDTSGGGGLDPNTARITEIAVSTHDGGEVFAGDDEVAILLGLEEYLRSLPPGLISTWNGAFFDMPFIRTRLQLLPFIVNAGPVLTHDPELKPKYAPPPGLDGKGYSAYWPLADGRVHQHLDISKAYEKTAADLGVKWSLKPVCIALGIPMIELDRENLHLYTPEERKAYCLSDTGGTRELTLRLLGLA